MKPILTLAALVAAGVSGANAQEWRSVYTDLELEQCTMIYRYEVGADYACPGHKGFPVLVSESDVRYAISYGFGAKDEVAFGQTFPMFNNPGTRIEWLLVEDEELGETPIGTIVRFFVSAPDYEDPDRQVLVVTKIEDGNTCQIAHIDALANKDANQMARDAAAELLAGFDCERDETKRIGDWSLEY